GSQRAEVVEKRPAPAGPFLRIDRFTTVMSTRWASSVRVSPRSSSSRSRCTTTGTSDGRLDVLAEPQPGGEDLAGDVRAVPAHERAERDRQPLRAEVERRVGR